MQKENVEGHGPIVATLANYLLVTGDCKFIH